MNLHEEIARIAYELYEKSGYLNGRDAENWLDAERIVLTRHASQDIEEPEGEEPFILEEGLIDEVEGTTTISAGRTTEDIMTVIEEMDVPGPTARVKEGIMSMREKIRRAKPAAAKGKKTSPKKSGPKSRETYH